MTMKRGDITLPYDVWNDRAEKLLQHMIFSMVIDVEGKAPRHDDHNPKTLADWGREDLENFHKWDVFIKAVNCGMTIPNKTQVERYLENGMATQRKACYIVTDKADRTNAKRRGHPAYNKVSVGSIRVRGRDSKYIKVAQPDKWDLIPKHERETVGKPAT